MANADVYTQRGKRRHRVCGVWSPLISDRLDGYCRGHLSCISLTLFFMEPYVCRASRPRAHLSARNLPFCCDLMAAVKTHGPFFRKLQARRTRARTSGVLKFRAREETSGGQSVVAPGVPFLILFLSHSRIRDRLTTSFCSFLQLNEKEKNMFASRSANPNISEWKLD